MTRTIFSSASDDWPTPQSFFDRLHARHNFALDVCATRTNRKTDAYYGLDHEDRHRRDGLARDWAKDARAAGGSVWMNPPYGRGIGDWIAKAAQTAGAGVRVVCLIPARTDTQWWHEYVLTPGVDIEFVRGRLRFGDATTSAPFASVVVTFNPPAATARSRAA